MDFRRSSSPASSRASSSPISIGWPSPSDSFPGSSRSTSSASSTTSSSSSYSATTSRTFTCAYPSWPAGEHLYSTSRSGFASTYGHSSAPSAYISDEDLFGDCSSGNDDAVAAGPFYLSEAPAPPRQLPFPPAAVASVQQPLQPLYAPEKPKKSSRKKVGRKVSSTTSPLAKLMTPIAESPLARAE